MAVAPVYIVAELVFVGVAAGLWAVRGAPLVEGVLLFGAAAAVGVVGLVPVVMAGADLRAGRTARARARAAFAQSVLNGRLVGVIGVGVLVVTLVSPETGWWGVSDLLAIPAALVDAAAGRWVARSAWRSVTGPTAEVAGPSRAPWSPRGPAPETRRRVR
jgi:hypothetical protein